MSQIQLIYLFVCLTAFDFIEAKPTFTCYDKTPISNSTFSYTLTADRPDLEATSKYFPATHPHHICVDGIWLVYQKENYMADRDNSIIMNGCHEIGGTYWPRSVHVVGEVGVKRLNLYSLHTFQANATSIFEDQATVVQFTSLILVGNISVEMYLQPNFVGFSFCLRANSPYVSVFNIREIIGITPGVIQSLKFGCSSSSKIIELVPNQLELPFQQRQ